MRRAPWPCFLVAWLTVMTAPAAVRGAERPAADLVRLADLLCGSFSSAAQAAADSDYLDIRLEMARIWPEQSSAIWLYVEQARADHLDRPYRQRVYRLSHGRAGTLVSEVFTLPSPLRFAGAWKSPNPLAGLTPDSLTHRTGCAIVLRPRQDGSFAGSTDGRTCPSDLRGAAYATSSVVIDADGMISWDRGFDDAGNQVWGAEKGGYVFRRLPAGPDRRPHPEEGREGAMRIHYLEIVTRDVDDVCAAYAAAQDLRFGDPDPSLGNARTAALPGGGLVGVRAPLRETEEPVVRPYWLVPDIEAALAAVVAAGGQVALPPLELPGHGTCAIYFLGGNQHGLWQE